MAGKRTWLARMKSFLGFESDKRTNTLRGNFVLKHSSPLEDDFYFGYDEPPLGQGSFGVVKRGTLRKNNLEFAIKIVKKDGNLKRIEREISLLTDFDHVNIIRLFSVYESELEVSFVFDLCTGGHLGQLVVRSPNRQVRETTAKLIIRQLASAVAHIHALGICHRDIKLQNILIENIDSPFPQMKLIDFGFAIRFQGAVPLLTRCGTTYCTAPEVFRESYDERCDMWSIGVITYILLSGHRPFTALEIPGEVQSGKSAVVTNILMGRYHFNYYVFRSISAEAISFIEKLFEPNYLIRCSSQAALKLPWLINTQCGPPLKEALSVKNTPLSIAVSTLCKKKTSSKMGNTGLVAVAFNSSRNGAPELRALFQDFDTECSGFLSKKAFYKAMKSVSPDLTNSDINCLFEAIDVDNDKQISFTEFLAATMDPRKIDTEELSKAFQLLDIDKKGFLTKDDFFRVLAVSPEKYHMLRLTKERGRTESEDSCLAMPKSMEVTDSAKKDLMGKILAMIAAADLNDDGVISYSEFLLGVMGAEVEGEEDDTINEMASACTLERNELDTIAINKSTNAFFSGLSKATSRCQYDGDSSGKYHRSSSVKKKKLAQSKSSFDAGVGKMSSVYVEPESAPKQTRRLSVSKSCPTNLSNLGNIQIPGREISIIASIPPGIDVDSNSTVSLEMNSPLPSDRRSPILKLSEFSTSGSPVGMNRSSPYPSSPVNSSAGRPVRLDPIWDMSPPRPVSTKRHA